MKLTNGEIWVAKPQLDKLVEYDMPWETSLAMSRLALKVNAEYAPIEQTRLGLIRKYGKPDKDNPNMTSVDKESKDYNKYMEEFAELMNKEVTVDAKKVELPADMDGALAVKPVILMALEKFLGAS